MDNMHISLERKGILFIISGPSGVGKNSIREGLFTELGNVAFSISHTTRAPRAEERNGADYYFVSRQEFRHMINTNQFVEWAEVHHHFYGTAKSQLQRRLSEGIDLLLDVDVQGCRQIKSAYPDAVAVFILPPSMDALEKRLRNRGIDDIDLRIRIARAEKEISEASHYDYIIVNDDLQHAYHAFSCIIQAERNRYSRVKIEFNRGDG